VQKPMTITKDTRYLAKLRAEYHFSERSIKTSTFNTLKQCASPKQVFFAQINPSPQKGGPLLNDIICTGILLETRYAGLETPSADINTSLLSLLRFLVDVRGAIRGY